MQKKYLKNYWFNFSFSEVDEGQSAEIHKSQQTVNKVNKKKITPRHIIVTLMTKRELKKKKKTLRVVRRKNGPLN